MNSNTRNTVFCYVGILLSFDSYNQVTIVLQHESLGMLKEMLFALDLALHVGSPADKRAADRLQRRSKSHCYGRAQHLHGLLQWTYGMDLCKIFIDYTLRAC